MGNSACELESNINQRLAKYYLVNNESLGLIVEDSKNTTNNIREKETYYSLDKITEIKETIFEHNLPRNVMLFPGTSATEIISSNNNGFLSYDYSEYVKLKKEVEIMKNKMNKSLPIHSIVFLCLNICAFTIFSTIFLIQCFNNIYLMHPLYLILFGMATLTLIATALASLKDWRQFIHEKG
jgi:hypothetical protein